MRPSSICSRMPPIARGDDRAALPHRLCDGEPEALSQALLRDHVGAPLKGVDDHRVLVGVRHRQQGEVHATADPAGQLRPSRLDFCEHLLALGVVGDRRHVGARQHEVRLLVGADVLGERSEHAQRVLQAIPARDLREQRDIEPQLALLDESRRGLHAADASRRAARRPPGNCAGGPRPVRRRAAPRSRW